MSVSTTQIVVTIAMITAVLGRFATVGADSRWVAALGRIIVARGSIPTGIPFAAAPTPHWPNTLVLAELAFNALQRALGDPGLIVAQLVAVAAAFSILSWDALAAGARARGITGPLALVALGALTTVAVARLQLFSLVLFPVMIALLRAEARSPSRRIWLALPLLALWSNLHGGALSGLIVLCIYLAFGRLRADPRTALGVGAGALVAMCLTPAGLTTVDYYHGLVTNLAAERGVGMWTPLGTSTLDLMLIGSALLLMVRAWRRRPAIWEMVVILVLAGLTIKAARDGVWLLFFLVAPAALSSRAKRDWAGLLPIGAVAAIALLALDVGQWSNGPSFPAAVQRAVQVAHGRPILAGAIQAEEIALDGGRIWAGDPLDAFPRAVQAAYLDWLDGSRGGRAALSSPKVQVVLVSRGSPQARLTGAAGPFTQAAVVGDSAIYVRRAQDTARR